ncbi:MAG: glycosyltransferase [bacterium]|nr:glycosyltransferase [bacterium]
MIREVPFDPIPIANYKDIVPAETYAEIEKLAKKLKGIRVIHLNTSPSGGGVAEILRSLVPLLKGLGLDADWFVSRKNDNFFRITKEIHNFLQGKKGDLTAAQRDVYLKTNQEVADFFNDKHADVWVIHDPQFVAISQFHKNLHPSIWRCHIDTSQPNLFVWRFLLPFIQKYDRYIFTLRKYLGPDLDYTKARIIAPAIDPLSRKNNPLDKSAADQIVARFGLDPSKPLVSQISRFDPWKDPWGVMDAYRIAKKEIPNLQLALIGAFAPDDPEADDIVADLKKYTKGDQNISILSNRDGVNDVEVNAFQVASDAIIQKSTREGFGLTVSEGMWKEKPVIGGRAGGIVQQLDDGETGFLVTTADQTAEKIVYLLENPEKSEEMGKKGREVVRHKFLITRLLLDHLHLYDELV